MALRENVLEFLEAEYPDGFTIMAVQPKGTPTTHLHNPKNLVALFSGFSHLNTATEVAITLQEAVTDD